MKRRLEKTISILGILTLLLASCSFPSGNTSTGDRPLPQAEVVFQVVLPQKLADGAGLYLEILDEVTGIYFNPSRYAMAMSSDTVYLYRLPLTIGAEVEYRYVQVADGIKTEFNAHNQQVVMRRLVVDGPQLVQDTISGWADALYQGALGRLRGQFIDAENQAPIPDLVVSIAGLQTTTSADGTFALENVPVGTHNLVVISKDGLYAPFQQYATISDQATTPVSIHLSRRETVKVTFVLSAGQADAEDLPIRLAGNLSTLGNRFGLLEAGSASTAFDLPVLAKTGKDKYSLTLDLPAGAYLKYKYSRGDGFWNAELNADGGFLVRELIVPEKATTLYDDLASFQSPGYSAVTINVSLPANTPANETLFIQFNPYDWMEALPMTRLSDTSWQYTISSPLQLVGTTEYRFCRNGDCERGSFTPQEHTFSPSAGSQTLSIAIDSWPDYVTNAATPVIENGGVSVLVNPGLVSGVEIPAAMPSAWQAGISNGLADASNLGAKWAILSPTWSVSSANLPMFEAISGQDFSWVDAQRLISYTKLAGLEPVLFPQIRGVDSAFRENYESNAAGWQQTFFERYERFILNYADLAQIMGVKAIIIGDPALGFSMSGDASSPRWSQLVADVRARFSGLVIGTVAVPSAYTSPDWLKDVDLIYALFSPRVTDAQNAIGEVNAQLDSLVYPLYTDFGKPILIGMNIPSSDAALAGCEDNNGSCALNTFYGPNGSTGDQSLLYNAACVASFSKPWVTGLITRGYYPFIMTTDASTSVYGKPAYDVLWFWYHYVLNLPA